MAKAPEEAQRYSLPGPRLGSKSSACPDQNPSLENGKTEHRAKAMDRKGGAGKVQESCRRRCPTLSNASNSRRLVCLPSCLHRAACQSSPAGSNKWHVSREASSSNAATLIAPSAASPSTNGKKTPLRRGVNTDSRAGQITATARCENGVPRLGPGCKFSQASVRRL
jgi:hypothetical protein